MKGNKGLDAFNGELDFVGGLLEYDILATASIDYNAAHLLFDGASGVENIVAANYLLFLSLAPRSYSR